MTRSGRFCLPMNYGKDMFLQNGKEGFLLAFSTGVPGHSLSILMISRLMKQEA